MRRHPEMHPENGGEKSGKCTFFSSLEFRHNSISCLVFLLWLSNKKQLVAPFTSTFSPSPPFLSVQTKQALCPFLLSVLLLRFNLNASPLLCFPHKNRSWQPRLVNSTLLWFKRIVIEVKCRSFYSRKGVILRRFLCSEKKWEFST